MVKVACSDDCPVKPSEDPYKTLAQLAIAILAGHNDHSFRKKRLSAVNIFRNHARATAYEIQN